LQTLSDAIGEITLLAIRDGLSALFLLRVESTKVRRMLNLYSQVGAHSPLHCTSMGKIILAYMTEEEIHQLAELGLNRFTPHTIVTKEDLFKEILHVRKNGYSLNLGEYEEGLHTLAVLVTDSNNNLVAAINVAAPSARLTEEKIPYFYKHLNQAAEAITEGMF
jgi:DNA-binding IclR family transcriptional regulator